MTSCSSQDCNASLETERILSCSTDGCNEIYCVSCFDHIQAEIGKEDHEFYYLCEGKDGTCGCEAIFECQEETIAFCEDCFKAEHKGRRKSHSKITLQRKRLKCEEKDNLNVFNASCYGEMRHELVLADEEKKWMQISSDNWNRFRREARDEYSPVISFIGSTGTGKSFLVSSFVGDDTLSPTIAPTNQRGSTSANINLYHAPGYDTDSFSFRRLLLLDCEGDGGTVPEMLRQRWRPLHNKISKKLNLSLSQNRTHVVREEFPRFAYLTSDVIVFLETVDFTRIQDYLAKFQKFIDATQKGVLSASTPSLLIIQNKVDPVAVNNRLSVSEATEDFFNLAFPFCRNHFRRSSNTLEFSDDEESEEDEENNSDDNNIILKDDLNHSSDSIQSNNNDSFIQSSSSFDFSDSYEKPKIKKKKQKFLTKANSDSSPLRKSKKDCNKPKRKKKHKFRSTDPDTITKRRTKRSSTIAGSNLKKESKLSSKSDDFMKKKKKSKKKSSKLKSSKLKSSSTNNSKDKNSNSTDNLDSISINESNDNINKKGIPIIQEDEIKHSPEMKTRSPPFRNILSPKTNHRNSFDDSVPTRAMNMLQGVEKGVTTMLTYSAIGEKVEKVSSNVKGAVGGVADRAGQMGGRVIQMGGNVLDGADIIKGKIRTDQPMTEKDRIKDDKRKRKEFLNSFEIIRCVRIPNYRYVSNIEPYLKAFRDEVKKMINHHAEKKLKNGTNYPESIWLDITKELVQSCTSFSDSQVGIRMAQIVGKVMQPASGEELSVFIYNFFNLLLGDDTSKDIFLKTRDVTENYLTLILANQLRKTGTKIESQKLINDPKHPFSELCTHMFSSYEKAISNLTPCEFKYKKEICTQLQKDHSDLHRFQSGKKKIGPLIFTDPEGKTQEERALIFKTKVYKKLNMFHKDVSQSIIQRIKVLSKIEKPPIMYDKSINSVLHCCMLCFSNPHDSLLACRHSFCKHCVKEVEEANIDNINCPLCYKPFALITDKYKIPGYAGYRILSLDGGGIKGIIELCIIKRICESLPGCRPYHLFDLVVGTSTGAIVSTALTLCKMDVDEAIALYKQFPAKVFKKRVVTNGNLLKVAYLLMGGKHLYRVSVLEQILSTLVNMDCDFIETMNDPTTPKIALVSTNYSANPMKPTLFCNYSTENTCASQYEDIEYCSTAKIHQGITASAAAPIFFAPYRIDNTFYVDGALSANNPTELALNEALRLWPKKPIDLCLSLGTGVPPNEIVADSLFSWASSLAAKATDPNVVHHREKLKFDRIREEISDRKYFRLNPPDISVDLDSTKTKTLDDLIILTNEYLDQPEIQEDLKQLINICIAKGFYICNTIDYSSISSDKVRVSFLIKQRIPLETHVKGFVFNHQPEGNFDKIDKTYDEIEEDNSHKISFIASIGSVYKTSIQLIVGSNEVPIHISGSPFTINANPII